MTSPRSLQELYPNKEYIVLLLAASAVLLVLGLSLPVLTVTKLWETNTFSIWSGIQNLWNEKYIVLSCVIFFFSILFPVAKLAALAVIWFTKLPEKKRKRILMFLSVLGKWSMLDVFVAAVLIVSIKLGALASAKVEQGIYFFGLSILLAMVATTFQNHLAKRAEERYKL